MKSWVSMSGRYFNKISSASVKKSWIDDINLRRPSSCRFFIFLFMSRLTKFEYILSNLGCNASTLVKRPKSVSTTFSILLQAESTKSSRISSPLFTRILMSSFNESSRKPSFFSKRLQALDRLYSLSSKSSSGLCSIVISAFFWLIAASLSILSFPPAAYIAFNGLANRIWLFSLSIKLRIALTKLSIWLHLRISGCEPIPKFEQWRFHAKLNASSEFTFDIGNSDNKAISADKGIGSASLRISDNVLSFDSRHAFAISDFT